MKAIWANKIAPGFADWYAAKKGFSGQKSDKPIDANRPVNLYQPVDDQQDQGMHGQFDDQARSSSWQWWCTTRRGWLSSAAVLGVAIIVALVWLVSAGHANDPDSPSHRAAASKAS